MRKLVGVRQVNEFDLYDIEVADDHCFELENGVIAHNSANPKYAPNIVSGGKKIYLSSDDIWMISRSQEKEGDELVGYTFNIIIEKSRTVIEKSRIPITVTFDGGIQRDSGLLELATEMGYVIKPTQGWYSRVNAETGEVEEKKWRAKEIDYKWFSDLLKSETFKQKVREKYQFQGAASKHADNEFDHEGEDDE